MAITKLKSGSVAEQFTAEAPDAKPAPKLRDKRQPLALALPPELLRTIDRFAV
jgi:hypothetical protein